MAFFKGLEKEPSFFRVFKRESMGKGDAADFPIKGSLSAAVTNPQSLKTVVHCGCSHRNKIQLC